MINKEIKKYIENNIFPQYIHNDSGHNLEHIKYVIKRSLKFAKIIPNINITANNSIKVKPLFFILSPTILYHIFCI